MRRFPISAVLPMLLLPLFLSQASQAMNGLNPDGSLDNYISDNIESIFQKVRGDFKRMQKINEAKTDVATPDSAAPTVGVKPTAIATPTDLVAQEPPVAATMQMSEKHRKRKVKPWVWEDLGSGVAVSVATYFILADAGNNSENRTQTWEPRFNPPQQ